MTHELQANKTEAFFTPRTPDIWTHGGVMLQQDATGGTGTDGGTVHRLNGDFWAGAQRF